MKTLLLAALLVCATASFAAEPLRPPIAKGDSLQVSTGQVFKNWSITQSYGPYVTLRHDGGMVKIQKSTLPVDLQAKLDPEPAKVDPPPPLEPLKDYWHFSKVDVRVTERSEDYIHYSWVAGITNPTGSTIKVTPHFRMLDKDGFVLEEDTGDSVTVPPRKTVTATGKSLMKKKLWDDVQKYEVEER